MKGLIVVVFALTICYGYENRIDRISQILKQRRSSIQLSSVSNSAVSGRSCGIDLGTTYSLVSVVENEMPRLLPIDGRFILPSVVTYVNEETILVGNEAVQARMKYAEETFSSIKRVIGRHYELAKRSGDTFQFGKRLKPVPATDPREKKAYCGLYCKSIQKILKPEEISAEILKKLIKRAEEYYKGEKVTKAVITIPAYFNTQQRLATERAGKLAGLEKIKLLKEPEAAAIAYGLVKTAPQLVLVIDLGGGTFDVSVLEVGDGLVEVVATNGDSHLGGDDFDKAIVDWILTDSRCISVQAEQYIRSDTHRLNRIKQIAIEAKQELSTQQNVTIFLPSVYDSEDIKVVLTRKKFEALAKPLLQRLLKPIRDVAIMAGINLPGESGIANVDSVIKEEEEDDDEIEEVEGYNLKALEQRERTGRQRSKERQKTEGKVVRELNRIRREGGTGVNFFPGGEPIDDVILVGGATRMPCIIKLIRVITGIDPKRYINPDEAICLGAGVLSGTLDGTIQGFEIMSQWKSALLRTIYEDNTSLKDLIQQRTMQQSSQQLAKEESVRTSTPPKKTTKSSIFTKGKRKTK